MHNMRVYIVDKIIDNSELLHYYCSKCYFAIIQLPSTYMFSN